MEGGLSEEEKRELLKAHETDIARINNLLKLESEKQQDALRRKLAERRHKHRLVEQKLQQEEPQRTQIEEDARDQLKFQREKAQRELQELGDLPKLEKREMEALRKKQFVEREEAKAATKRELQTALRRAHGRAATQRLLSQFDEKEELTLRRMEEDFKRQAQYVRENIEDVATQRADEIRQRLNKAREEIHKTKQAKLDALDERLGQLRDLQQNEQIDRQLAAREADAEVARRKALAELRARHVKEMEQLAQREQSELEGYDAEAAANGGAQYEVEPGLRAKLHERREQRSELEEKLRALEGLAGEELEKQKAALLAEMGAVEKELVTLEREAGEQRARLQERLAARKERVRAKMSRRAELEKERVRRMEEQQKEELLERASKLQTQLEEELARLQREGEVPPGELAYAVERAVDVKQAEELNMLLAVLLNEKAERLKTLLNKLFQDKLDELSLVRASVAPKIAEAQAEHAAGRLSETALAVRVRELREEESERKKDLELKYFEAQQRAEQEVLDALDAKHDEVLVAMKRKQAEEKTFRLKQALARDQKTQRALELERRDALAKDIEDYAQELRAALLRKQQERELERARLYAFQRKSEQKLREAERRLQLEGAQREQAEREKLGQRREQIEKRRQEMEAQLARRGELTEAERARVMAEHEASLAELQRVVGEEHKRQLAMTTAKLEERRGAKEQYKEERDRRLALFRMHYDQMLEDKLKDLVVAQKQEDLFARLERRHEDQLFEKMHFPSKARAQQEREANRARKGSVDSMSSGRSERRSSLVFGRSFTRKHPPHTGTGGDPQNLAAVLEKLGHIDELLDRKSKNLKERRYSQRLLIP